MDDIDWAIVGQIQKAVHKGVENPVDYVLGEYKPIPLCKRSMNKTNIKIEKGIPLPPRRADTTGLTSTLRQLEIGDSFTYGDGNKQNAGNIHLSAKVIGIRVATRKEGETRRVWRIA